MKKNTIAIITAGILSLTAMPALANQLNIVGTGDGIDMLRAVAAAYLADNPKSIVNIPNSIGSGGAVAAVGTDKEVLGRVARPLSAAEQAQGLIYTPAIKIPSAIIAHPSANVNNITSAQLTGIYTGTLTNWKEVGGADIKIRVVRREDADSTLAVLRASMPGFKDIVITPMSKMATTTQEAIEAVRDIEGAVGFAPYSSQLDQTVNVLKIDNRAPSDLEYPSSVKLAFIHKTATVTPDAKSFLSFAKSEKAKKVISSMGGSIITD
jgi:phosphate transport system substrate-binding protein